MPHPTHDGLTAAQVDSFIETGVLRIDNAFPDQTAREGRDLLWQAIGLSPDRPERWVQPVLRIPFMAGEPFVSAANTARLRAAYDRLAGPDRWHAPTGLGSFVIRFLPAPRRATMAGTSTQVSAPGPISWTGA